ncbi:UBX domain-containing protein [Pseudoscourfieldia marina]
MADSDVAVTQFLEITGTSDTAVASSYVEAHSGDVAAAVEAFFASMDDGGPGAMGAPGAPMVTDSVAPTLLGAGGAGAGGSRSAGAGRRGGAAAGGGNNVRGFSDLARTPQDDEEAEQEFYTGGEKSGLAVVDPKKRARGGGEGDAVASLFDRARESGAVDGRPEDLTVGGSGAGAGGFFTGQARTLSGAGSEPTTDAPPAAGADGDAPVVHTITFWENGFTVDDGPLRGIDDPANAPFMQSIARGECPRELEPTTRGAPVHVNLVRKMEPYSAPPEPKYRAFAGTGNKLVAGDAAEGSMAAQAAQAAAAAASSKPASSDEPFSVDDSLPSTSIQLRLRDGSRAVARFNQDVHTVADIRGFIDRLQGGGGAPYALVSGFPPKVLTDESQTISAAGLAGAVVQQK